MDVATAPYNAVYHFRDDRLFQAFIAEIPRSQLLEHVRRNDALRSRNFPGFRISSTFPTERQLHIAYEKEIVDRHNGNLANSLCTHWIGQHQELVTAALKSLGVDPANPSDADLWIGDVHDKLALESSDDSFRLLIRTLTAKFSDDDIHIFVSIISFGRDQQILQAFIQQELLEAAKDLSIQKDRLETELKTATRTIADLKQRSNELNYQLRSELQTANQALETLLQEHDQLAERLAQEAPSIQALANQLEQVKTQLIERKRALDTTERQKQKAAQSIARQRRELLTIQAASHKSLEELSRTLDKQASYGAKVAESLEEVNERLLAKRSEEIPVIQVTETVQPELVVDINASESSESANLSTAPAAQHSTEELGNNAICYQGIQRLFRNAVVLFLRGRLSHLYPDDHVQRLKKIFGEDWDKAALNANLSRENLGTSTVLRDDYDLVVFP
jgi:hypothetical protein